MRPGVVEKADTLDIFRSVYQDIENDIRALRNGSLKLEMARTILVARKTQLRTAELALALQRLQQKVVPQQSIVQAKFRKVG